MSISRTRHHPLQTPAWVRRLCPLPNPLHTLDEYERAMHRDLAELSTPQLMGELRRVQHRLDYDPSPLACAWLAERQSELRAELRRRENRR